MSKNSISVFIRTKLRLALKFAARLYAHRPTASADEGYGEDKKFTLNSTNFLRTIEAICPLPSYMT